MGKGKRATKEPVSATGGQGTFVSAFAPEVAGRPVSGLPVPAPDVEELRAELEAQNQELQRTLLKLQESSDYHLRLYDSAPVAYLTLDRKGLILEANRLAVGLLGGERKDLLKRRFSSFVAPEARDQFHRCFRKLWKTADPLECELKVSKHNGTLFDGHLIGTAVADDYFSLRQCRIAILDVSGRKNAEQSLGESERGYRALMDNMLEGCVVLDFDWRVVYVNNSISMLRARRKDEILGHSFMELNPGIEKTPAFSILEKCMAKRAPANADTDFVYADGTKVWISFTVQPVAQGIIILSHDITRRKQVEEELQEREQMLSNLLDSIPDYLTVRDRDYRVTLANKPVLVSYGRDVLGQYCYKAFGGHDDVCPDCPTKNVYATGKTVSNLERTNALGETVEVTAFPLKDEKGSVVSVVELVRNITERRKMETGLREAAEQWSATFNAIPDMLSIHDASFRVVRVNKAFAEAFRMKPEELEGKLCYELFHGSDKPIQGCPHFCTMHEQKTASAEIFEPRLGKHLEMTTSPVLDEDGHVTGSIHIARDVTARKEAQEQLVAYERLATLGKVSGSISHELRNPLATIDSSTFYLRAKLKDSDDKVHEHLDRIHSAVLRSTGIIQSLLDLTRMREPRMASVNLKTVLSEAIEAAGVPESVKLTSDFQAGDAVVRGDFEQLRLAFLNIVKNAVQAAGDKGELRITARPVGPELEVSFADNGPGVSAENLLRLFQPLFTTKAKGIGLGLPVVKAVVEKHGGSITAASEPGKGATFTIRLPRQVEPEKTKDNI